MSIIADALKKAQEKRTVEQERTSSDPLAEQTLSESLPSTKIILDTNSQKSFMTALVERKNLILIGFLLCALIAMFFIISKSVPSSGSQSPTNQLVSVKTDIVKEEKTKPVKTKISNYISGIKKTAYVTGLTRLPELNGIMYSPPASHVVLDGKMLSEGDTINGFLITKIFADKVKIKHQEQVFELKL